jgi:hypothetical protein
MFDYTATEGVGSRACRRAGYPYYENTVLTGEVTSNTPVGRDNGGAVGPVRALICDVSPPGDGGAIGFVLAPSHELQDLTGASLN